MGSESDTLLQNGDVVLARYRVVDALATGGHSVVYLGQDERLNRPVCIKIFSGDEAESGVGRTSYEHFVQEAFALSKLTHPSTLRIYDFGHLPGASPTEPGPPLQICEFMNGGTLSQMVRDDGPPPLTQAIAILTAMCAALAEAHSLGIIHRDIKPQNILFGNVGNERLAKLADFGIAKWSSDGEVVDHGQRADDTQIVAGRRLAMYSPSWAAPEQIDGRPASPATDVYSLAAVGVYLLTGEVIFSDEEVFSGYKKRRNAPELVRNALAKGRAQGGQLPEALWPVLCKALAFAPEERYHRITDFSAGLMKAALTARTPTPAAMPTPPLGGPPNATSPSQLSHLRSAVPTVIPDPALPFPLQPMDLAMSSGQVQRAQVTTVVGGASVGSSGAITLPVDSIRLPLLEEQSLLDRRIVLVYAPDSVADLACPGPAKLRVSMVPAAHRVAHLKSMSCFIAPVGGRPSSAMQVERETAFDLVSPAQQMLARGRLIFGFGQGGIASVRLGTHLVVFDQAECRDPICVDFGPGSIAYIVYTQGTPPRRV